MKKTFTKCFAFVLAALMLVSMAMTVSAEEAPSYGKTDETVKIMLSSEPQSVTALSGLNDQISVAVEFATGARLWELNPITFELDYSLAEGYEMIDETHYRITLRDNAVFEDGTPVTAEDVLYSYGCYSEAALDGVRFMNVAESVIEDDKHFILAYDTYVPGWYNSLAEGSMVIYNKADVEAKGGPMECERVEPLSAGRYHVQEWKPGEYIMLERNENYWDPNYVGYYKFIKLNWTSDSASRLLAVKSGDADVAQTISVSEAITLEADPTANAVFFDTATVFNLYFNCTDGIFSDPKVREAMMYAIDSQGLNMLINMGKGVAVQGFVPTQNEHYEEYYPGGVHPYDEAKAKELLTEAGYPDGFTAECIVLKANLQAATIVQELFRKVGVTLNVTTMEPNAYQPAAKAGEYDVTIGNNTNGYITHDNFKLLDPEERTTVIGGPKISDPVMIEIIKKGRSFDPEVSAEGWHEMFQYIFGNTCLVGLYNKIECAAINPNIEGLKTIKRDYLNFTELHPIQ